jgi:hypothetical protein
MLNVIMLCVIVLIVVLLIVVMLSAVMVSVVMLSVVMLSVVMLNVVMLNVVAPVQTEDVRNSAQVPQRFTERHISDGHFFESIEKRTYFRGVMKYVRMLS